MVSAMFSILNANPEISLGCSAGSNGSVAYAEDVAGAASNLESAKSTLNQVQAEYNIAINAAQSLQTDIQDATNNALVAQDAVIEKTASLNKIAVHEYKEGAFLPFITMLLGSSNIDDFFKNLDYSNRIMKQKTDAIEEQAMARNHFNDLVKELNEKSDSYNFAIQTANAKLSEAQSVVDKAQSTLASAEAEALRAQQQSMEKSSPDIPQPSPSPSPSPDPGGTWQSGVASAYGGSSDPGSGTRTATGEAVTDSSMGVAVPMSWPNYRSYFHHAVQIKLGGTIVIAKINDCGNMGGGARSLDLQPGVFKAFGYNSCQAWGIRTVEYKIL